MPGHRAQLLGALEETVEAAVKWRKEREELQIEMFGLDEVQNWDVELPDIRPYTTGQQLDFERELLGLYLSGHPLDAAEQQLAPLGLDRLVELSDAKDGAIAIIGVMIVSLKPFTNKKGLAMGFLELEDRIMRVEAVVFPTIWKRIGSKLEKGGLAIIQATVQQQDDDYKLIVEDCVPIDHADMDLAGQVRRLQKQAQARAARSTGGSASTGGASSQGRAQNAQGQAVQVQRPNITGNSDKAPSENASGSAEARHGHEQGRSASSERKPQRVYIKIMSQNEEPAILEQLKGLLAGHAGQLDTVLFYVQGQKSIALSGSYRVKPSPQLIASVEQLLGAGTIVVK